jgi:hypothetical protein
MDKTASPFPRPLYMNLSKERRIRGYCNTFEAHTALNPSILQPEKSEMWERFSQISCFKKKKSAIPTNRAICFRAE